MIPAAEEEIVTGRSRGFQDPGIGHGTEAVRQPPNPPPSYKLSASPAALFSPLVPFRRGWHGPGGRGSTPGITTTVDAARYFWRQVDMSLTCTTVGCWLRREKGVLDRRERIGQCSSTSNTSTLPAAFISIPAEVVELRYGAAVGMR